MKDVGKIGNKKIIFSQSISCLFELALITEWQHNVLDGTSATTELLFCLIQVSIC